MAYVWVMINLCNMFGDTEYVIQGSEVTIPKMSFWPHLKPYWSKELEQLHKEISDSRFTWFQATVPIKQV